MHTLIVVVGPCGRHSTARVARSRGGIDVIGKFADNHILCQREEVTIIDVEVQPCPYILKHARIRSQCILVILSRRGLCSGVEVCAIIKSMCRIRSAARIKRKHEADLALMKVDQCRTVPLLIGTDESRDEPVISRFYIVLEHHIEYPA